MAVEIPYDIPLKGLKTKRTEAKETQKNEARRESRKRLIQKISMTCRCMYVFFWLEPGSQRNILLPNSPARTSKSQ